MGLLRRGNAAGGALNAEKHMYEEIFLVVEGRGTTEVWQEGDNEAACLRMAEGLDVLDSHECLAPPGERDLRRRAAAAGTTAPNVLNMINNVQAVFNNPFVFRDRFDGAEDFFKPKDEIEPDPVRGLAMRRTNFIPDVDQLRPAAR